MKSFSALLVLFTVASAIPSPHGCRPTRQTYVAQYDDLPYNEGSPNPIPPHYYGLSYTTFQVDQYDFWFPPTSGNQWAMAFGGSGNISIPDSPPKQSFSLDSFSYACISGVPQPECLIRVWGWKTNGRLIKRDITFLSLDPGPVEAFVMNKTRFSRQWKDLKSVGFSIERADNGGNMFGGLALDDVKYEIKTRC